MSAYLQRLYDAATTASANLDARPAQRSSSPLLAVDQRLATTTWATSFLLGLPGEPEPRPVAESEGLAVPRTVPREPVVREETPVRVVPPRPAPVRSPDPEIEERDVLQPRQSAGRETPTTLSPAAEPRTVPGDLPLVAHPHPRPPASEETRATSRTARPTPQNIETLPLLREPTDPGPVQARPERLDGPPVTSRPDVAPAPTEVTAAPEAATRPGAPTVAPRLLHPAPAPVPESLPPPAPPRTADLAEQVRRLVREEMPREASTATPAREHAPGSAADPRATAARSSTAEAMSVIGPLDRPVRATSLYGLRLR